MDQFMQMYTNGATRGNIAPDESLTEKARKYVELCDGPVAPDFEAPPYAVLVGEEARWSSNYYGADNLMTCTACGLEQIAATTGLAKLCNAPAEGYRLGQGPDRVFRRGDPCGDPRLGIVAAQGALALATEANWTNLATLITHTPTLGRDAKRGQRTKFELEGVAEGLSDDQSDKTYIKFMEEGPVLLLARVCYDGGCHPCVDRFLGHTLCKYVLERLLSFIARGPLAVQAGKPSGAKLKAAHKAFQMLTDLSMKVLHGLCVHAKGGEAAVRSALQSSQRVPHGSALNKELLSVMERDSWTYQGMTCVCGRAVSFCSKPCQRAHWKVHKRFCQAASDAPPAAAKRDKPPGCASQ